MRLLKQNPWLPGLGVLLAAVVVGGIARADVTTDQPGSIVIYPKVIFDGARDTLIQLTNTSTMSAYVHCVYTDTSTAVQGVCSGSTPPLHSCAVQADCDVLGDGDCIRCQSTDFEVELTPLQPTIWRVSTGREPGLAHGTFFDKVIPKNTGMLGELKCIQVDAPGPDGIPSGGNALKGEATIENLATGQISEYSAIAIQAKNASPVVAICVGGPNDGASCPPGSDFTTDCPGGLCKATLLLDNAEYNACPSQLLVNHFAEGATDPFTQATVHSELTLVPCSEDIEGTPTSTTVHFEGYNEEEQHQSAVLPFTCWANISFGGTCVGGATPGAYCVDDPDCLPVGTACVGPLPRWMAVGNFGSLFGKTRVSPTSSSMPAVLGVLEEFYDHGGSVGTAAVNLHVVGSRPGDQIKLPIGN